MSAFQPQQELEYQCYNNNNDLDLIRRNMLTFQESQRRRKERESQFLENQTQILKQ